MNGPRRIRVMIGAQHIALGLAALAVCGLAVLGTLLVARWLSAGQAEAAIPTATVTPAGAQTGGEAATPSAVIATAASGSVTHTVQQGETLIGIAQQYGVPIELLQAANHLTNPRLIYPGQQLIIPNTAILTPAMPLGTGIPTATGTVAAEDPANMGFLSGWPRSIADGTQQQLDANYPLTVERERFRLHYEPGTYAEKYQDEVVSRVERALANVESRMGVHLAGTFDAYVAGTLFAGDDAHLRGQSRSRDRRLFFLSDGTGTPAENDYVVTHELTHLVAWNTWGAPSSTMLSEGLATYIGKPELEGGGFMPYDQLCLGIQAAGQLPPLASIEREYQYFQGHIEDRFTYFGSACFVDYLIRTYGLDKMSRLYHSSEYETLYGKSLDALDSEWRASLDARRGEMTIDPGALTSYTQEVSSAYIYLFQNFTNTASTHQAYLALDKARIALWQGDYPSTRKWLDQVYALTGSGP